MRVKSFAKINLGLEVLKKRQDGYHDIRTLFQTVDLYDILEFNPIQQEGIFLEGSDTSVPWDERNLIYKAAQLLKRQFGIKEGIEIQAVKNIPAGKGLGGGSSNAAITLYALNHIWRLGMEKTALMHLGSRLGADIPFFLEGGLCLGEGKGDKIFPLRDIDSHRCLLAYPSVSVSSASVYAKTGIILTSEDKDSKIIRFLESRELSFLVNDLENIVFRIYPQIETIKSLIQKQGSELSLMSGSGSAVFGLFLKREGLHEILKKLQREHAVALVKTLPRKRYWRNIQTGV